MEIEWATEQDHVIQRADGSCLYNLANVVDDHDMRITHVIRAEEHLSNTARQIFIAQGLGYELPEYAHVPYIAAPGSKEKISKRKISQYLKYPDFKKVYDHGEMIGRAIGLATSADTFNPVIVDFYREVGYLPDAIINYLVLLGWSLDDKTEFFTRQEMIGHFSLERVNKGPASFDPKKLFAFQARYMQLVPLEKKVDMALPYLQKAGLIASMAEARPKVTAVVQAAGERFKVAGDILEYAAFFVPDERLTYDEAAFEKNLRKPPEARGLLAKFREQLVNVEPFDASTLEKMLHVFRDNQKIELKQIVHSLRLAVSGCAVGFGLFEALAILGRKSCLARIDRALGRL
jgi:glutamyl-tRNA synthetase